jgi:NarL family two-component system response regulator LiaR
MELVREGKEQSCSVSWRGEPYELNCMSVNGRVVSVLAPGISPEAQKLEQLTARERDVLRLLAEGMNSARIAESLSIGSGTVRCHVEHLREKLGAPTRAAIVGKAFRLGYLR